MSIFVLAAFASCVSALASLVLLGLNLFNTFRYLQRGREKYYDLSSYHPPVAESSHLQEQCQE